MPLKIFFSVFCLFLSIHLQAQQTFNSNNVLIISKAGNKKKPFLRSGRDVSCRLKTGGKVKGMLLIYPNFIVIGDDKVQLTDIEFIKPTSRAIQNGAERIGTNELGRVATSITPFDPVSLVNAGIGMAFEMAFRGRRLQASKGWMYEVVEFERQPFNKKKLN